jgi:hypothetical protein
VRPGHTTLRDLLTAAREGALQHAFALLVCGLTSSQRALARATGSHFPGVAHPVRRWYSRGPGRRQISIPSILPSSYWLPGKALFCA